MNIGVLGVGVGGANLGAAERPSARDIILDAAALASSLSLDQLSQLHNLVVGHGNDTLSTSLLVDGSTGSGSVVDGLTNGLDGGAQDVREESSRGSAMELKDTSLGGLFCFSDLGSLVSASTNTQDTGQPQLPMSTSTSGLISLPSLQSSQTITPAYLDTSLSILDGISSSGDHLLELEYLPESLSMTKPFGSLSDLQSLSISALNGDYPLAYDTVEATTDVMDMSWLNQSNVIVLGPDDHDSRDNQCHSSAISNPLREMYKSVSGDATFGMGHDQSYQDTATGGHYLGINGSISSIPSYLPGLIELSIPPSLSPMMLHYDGQGRIVTNVVAETGNMAGDSEDFMSVLNGLGHVDGVESSLNGLKKQGDRVRDTEVGIEPTIVLRRAGFSGSGVSSANGITSHGSKRGQIQTAPVQYTNIPIPLPIPTRSRPTLLKGWQGDEKSGLVSSFGEKHQTETIQTEMLVGQNKNKKRKRLGQPQSEGDESKERQKSTSFRREMLGLRAISEDGTSSTLGDELPEEKDRKRRRIGSLSIANLASSKDKEKEIKTDWDGSDEESESDSDTDVYCPSRSSSPAFDNYGSSSLTTNSSRRSGSVQTMTTVTTSMSSSYEEGDEEEQGQRKKNKGKAKGSAALALAKITMMSGKPAISPWGTYVPFPIDENQEQDIFPEDDTEIRAGRRRRNGHIPLPVPVPHLIKKSRGRKVPYVAKEATSQGDRNSSGSSKRVREGEQWKRMFVCEVLGCGKCFVRGEHLKRHVRSIHTHDKRTFFPPFFSLLSYSIVRKRTPAHMRDVISRSADVTTWDSTCGSICQIIVDLFVIVDCAISHAIYLFFTFTCLPNLLPTSATMSTPESLSPTSANDDESTRIHIAVRALDDMRSRISVPSSVRATRGRSRGGGQDESQQKPTRDFVSRMSLFPLVGTALRAYEQGKASSRMVKYGAQMVESGMKTISKPVIDRLPVNQIDEFACRQLDRLDKYRWPSDGPESPESSISPHPTNKRMSHGIDAGPSSISFDRGRSKLQAKTLDRSLDGIARMEHQEGTSDRWEYIDGERNVPKWIQSTRPSTRAVDSGTASPIDNSRAGSPIMTEDQRTSLPDGHQVSHLRHRHPNGDTQVSEQDSQDTDRQVVQRSIWQAVLLEAGGLGVALSDENIRRLKYCLNWLLCATAHIDAQILILRDLIESIQPLPRTNSVHNRRPPISEEHLRKLKEVRKDIVTTIRQMVDVVSKCAGGALPEPARSRVRSFVLKLPQRWASRTAATGAGSTPTSGSAGEWERETIAAAGSNMGSLRRGQGRDRRAVQRERGTGSRAPSPSPSDSHARSLHSGQNSTVAGQQLTQSNAAGAARRILTLATESLDMMRNVTGVVKDSLDRADAWVNRLRMVGVQRGGQEGSSGSDEILNDETLNEDLQLSGDGLHYHAVSTSRDDHQVLPQTHRSDASIASSISVGRGEDPSSGSVPASPFTTATTLSHGTSFMSTSSYTTGSMSTPSTPSGTSFTSLPIPSVSMRDMYCDTVTRVPSPGAIPLADMHIASRLNTPKNGVVGLSAEDEVLIENGKEEQVMSSKRLDMALQMEVDES